jgi:hypothetical protein
MAVKWESVSGYIQEAFDMKGQIERSMVMAFAEADNASDDVIDTLDAIGSRVFRSVADAQNFLVSGGYVQK